MLLAGRVGMVMKVLRKLALGVLIVCLVAAAAVGGYSIALFFSKKTVQQQPLTLKDVEKPDKLLENYKKLVESLGKDYPLTTNTPLGSTILYAADDASTFTLSAQSGYFAAVQTSTANSSAIMQKNQDFLQGKGLTPTSSPAAAGSMQKRYTSNNVMCDISTMSADDKAYTALSCTTLSYIKNEYAQVKKLIELTNDTQITESKPVISVLTVAKDNKQLKTLVYTTRQFMMHAYFAAVDDKWEYLGKKQIVGTEGATMEPTNDFKAAIQKKMATYGDLLKPLLEK
ncbi:MAG: hypothetical protein WAQ25_03365 [Candidatus Saccharimonas sp.]